jgi:hypothetical protein
MGSLTATGLAAPQGTYSQQPQEDSPRPDVTAIRQPEPQLVNASHAFVAADLAVRHRIGNL